MQAVQIWQSYILHWYCVCLHYGKCDIYGTRIYTCHKHYTLGTHGQEFTYHMLSTHRNCVTKFNLDRTNFDNNDNTSHPNTNLQVHCFCNAHFANACTYTTDKNYTTTEKFGYLICCGGSPSRIRGRPPSRHPPSCTTFGPSSLQ
mgnify:CR=1 FL=1